MRIGCTLVLFLAFILNCFELSSHFECLPNGDPIPGVPRRRTFPESILSISRSNSTGRTLPLVRHYSPDMTVSLAIPRSSDGSPSLAASSLRARSKSPLTLNHSFRLFGFELEKLKFIRLIAHSNPNRIFEFRIYAFPPNKSIQLKTYNSIHKRIPTGEQVVLSTPNGDVYAFFEKKNKEQILRGIYTCIRRRGDTKETRAKVNMYSGAVDELTPQEIAECPLGYPKRIPKLFRIVRV